MVCFLSFACASRAAEKGKQAKIQNETVRLHQELNKKPLAVQPGALERTAMLTDTSFCFNSYIIFALNETNTHDVQCMNKLEMA